MKATINTKRKVLLAFVVGVAAILMAFVISFFGFNKMLTVVDDLAAPNLKLKTLNNLFQRVAELEHTQRLEALETPGKTDQDFLKESNSLLLIVDSLRRMPWSDSLQFNRLGEIERILHQRDSLFVKYLQVKSNYLRNKKLSKKFDTLARMLAHNVVRSDTNIRTTQKKRTTISYSKDSTIKNPEQKRSFFSRLFKKKQLSTIVQQPKEKITEEIVVTVDTLALAKRNNNVEVATKLIQELGTAELSRRKRLANRELMLLKTTNILFSQVTDIVHQVEAEEILSVRKNNEAATYFFNESIRKIILVLVIFCLVTAGLVYFILIDITRSNFFRARLKEEKDRAEELGQVKQRFLYNMSHEIRTPLQSILGFAEQLLKKINPEIKSEVQAIYSSSEHLLHVVNEVLDYSRLDSGKWVFENKKFYLSEIVEEVALAMKVQAEKKGLRFYFDDEQSEGCYVLGDPFRLKQILYNLVGNAVKFTDAGEVRVLFKTMTLGKNISAEFEIIDTGIGIHEDELDKIFQRFEQANASIGSVYGGSGLGLTIVKKLVEALKGTLTVRSTFGKGSNFLVNLFFETVAEDDLATINVQPILPSNMHVLVVDDDSSILELCKIILSNANISCAIENNPALLYEKPVPENVTHILMDVRMGSVNGFELSRFLKSKIKPEIPIIAMSAMVQLNDEPNFYQAFDALLLKPFHADELKNILTRRPRQKSDTAKQNFTSVHQLTLGNTDLLRAALTNFIHETEIDLLQLDSSVRLNNSSEVKEILHKMKGRIAQFGYLSVSTSMNELEGLLKNENSIEEIRSEMGQLKEAVGDILSKTRAELVLMNQYN